MTPSPTNHNNKETTSKVKEVPRISTTTSLRRLEQALEAFVEGLEGYKGALLGFEEALLELEEGALNESAPKPQDNREDPRLLSPQQVCRELGANRTSVYRRLGSGEIPSLKLGHSVRVRRTELKEYIKDQRRHQCSPGEDNGSAEP